MAVGAFGPDGEIDSRHQDVAAGEVVRVGWSDLPGEHGLTVDGARCGGRFTLESGRETDLILRITDRGCMTVVVRVHDLIDPRSATAANIYGTAPRGTRVDVTSVDDPVTGPPMSLTPDDTGWFVIDSLPGGRYRFDARRAGIVAATAEIDVATGDSVHVDLTRPASPAPD